MKAISVIVRAVEKSKVKLTNFDIFAIGFFAGFMTLAVWNIIIRLVTP